MIEFPMAPSTCFRLLLMLGLYTGFAKADILFEDHFDSGASPQWVSVKPSQWVEDGWFHTQDMVPDDYRNSDAFVHDGDPLWTDYTLSLKVDPLLTRDPFTGAFIAEGEVYFRTSNIQAAQFGFVGNYYRLYYYRQPENPPFEKPGLGLDRCQNVAGFSCETIAAVVPAIFAPGPLDFSITLTGADIKVTVDGSEVIDVIDPAPLSHGGIGVGAIWEAHARFDDVVVNAVPEPSSMGLLSNTCYALFFNFECTYC